MTQVPDNIQSQIDSIGNSVSNIRSTIRAKGVTPAGGLNTYAAAIDMIAGGYRNIGEIITSTIPLTDAGLHLLDGALISGSGSYSAFVDYIADLYEDSNKYNNVEVTGSIVDNNGVLSNFGTSAFVVQPLPFTPSTNSWEAVFKVTTGNDVASRQFIVSGAYPMGGGAYDLMILNSKLCVNISSVGNIWDIASDTSGSYTILAETTYYIKVEFNGTNYIISYSLDGESFTADITIANSTPVYQLSTIMFGVDYTGSQYSDPFLGSIDLNSCYININSSRFWTGRLPIGFTDEGQWQSAVTTYGVCGKFVYDSVANTVRLPKYNSKIYTGGGTAPVKGNGMTLGLTNGSSNGALVGGGNWVVGVLPADYDKPVGQPSAVSGFFAGRYGVTTDATKSGIIADLANITTSLDGYYYIVIATTAKTDIQVDIDEIATDLNGKADVDLTNVNNSGTSTGAGWAMPSGTYVDLTLGASGTQYTAPANGWVCLGLWVISAGQQCAISSSSGLQVREELQSGTHNSFLIMPVLSNDKFTVTYGTYQTFGLFRFIYAQGSEHEAS